jgi:uncharacterized membrane protein
MKPQRLDQLSDGIFAIIITLLAFDLRIPEIDGPVTDESLGQAIVSILPIFLSFMLSFALIFTYWRAHHFIVSIYAKNIDNRLTTINAVFFFFIALLPFSSRLIAEYNTTELSVIIYALNIIALSLSLLWMRSYVLASGHIHHAFVTKNEKRRGLIRIMVPLACAIGAIILSLYSTWASFVLLTLAIVFNLMSRSTRWVNTIIEKVNTE